MFVCRVCVSRRLFTVKTLLFPEIHVTPRQIHIEFFLSPPMDQRLVSAPYVNWSLKTESGSWTRTCPFFNRQPKNVPKYALKYVFKNKIWNKKEEEEEDGFPKFFFCPYFMTWSTSRSIRAPKRSILPSFEKTLKKPTSFPGIFPLKNGGKRVLMIAWETSLFHGCTHTNTSYTQREICNHVWKGKNSSKVLNFNKKWRKTTKGTHRSIFWRRRSKSTIR